MIRIAAALLLGLVASGGAAQGSRLPLFDAHLHYNDDAQAPYPVADVLARFRDAGVTTILATSRPNDGTKALLVGAARAGAGAPRVVPFIRPYRNLADRGTWFNDPEIFALIEARARAPDRLAGYRRVPRVRQRRRYAVGAQDRCARGPPRPVAARALRRRGARAPARARPPRAR